MGKMRKSRFTNSTENGYKKKRSQFLNVIGFLCNLYVNEMIRNWTKDDVEIKVKEFGPAFAMCATPLRIDGPTLLNTSNADLLTFVADAGVSKYRFFAFD